jgi:hypothetical protein
MRARTNLVFDVAIGTAFLATANPALTGLSVHEWLGLLFASTLIAHVVLHWEWATAVTRVLFGRQGRGKRLNYTIDAVLFVALTAATLSGLLISRHVLGAFGLPPHASRAWRGIHSFASDVSIAALGVHLGLHWNWLAINLPRLAVWNRGQVGRTRGPAPVGTAASCPSADR